MAKLIEWWQVHMIDGKRPELVNDEYLLLIYPDSSDGKVVTAGNRKRLVIHSAVLHS